MKRVVLALAALGILSVSSVMAAPVSYQSVLQVKLPLQFLLALL